MVEFEPRFLEILKRDIAALRESGALPSEAKLREYYRTFASRFGPERLSALNGEPLLRLLHQRRTPTSLVAWLEPATPDEFAEGAGAITGETRAAYGVFQEGKDWFKTGTSAEHEITLHEAVSVAEAQRDEIVHACELVRELPRGADDDAYTALETKIALPRPVDKAHDDVGPDALDLAIAPFLGGVRCLGGMDLDLVGRAVHDVDAAAI